jgi:hypothetical protein
MDLEGSRTGPIGETFRYLPGGVQENHQNPQSRCRILGPHTGGYERFYLLEYIGVYFVESQPMFLRNMSPPSSGSKNKPRAKPAQSRQQELPEDNRSGRDARLVTVPHEVKHLVCLQCRSAPPPQ